MQSAKAYLELIRERGKKHQAHGSTSLAKGPNSDTREPDAMKVARPGSVGESQKRTEP